MAVVGEYASSKEKMEVVWEMGVKLAEKWNLNEKMKLFHLIGFGLRFGVEVWVERAEKLLGSMVKTKFYKEELLFYNLMLKKHPKVLFESRLLSHDKICKITEHSIAMIY